MQSSLLVTLAVHAENNQKDPSNSETRRQRQKSGANPCFPLVTSLHCGFQACSNQRLKP